MASTRRFTICLLSLVFSALPLWADEGAKTSGEGTIFTFWPLIDYRESPDEQYSNLSLLGPLFKLQHRKDTRDLAFRPLFYSSSNEKDDASVTEYLYPLASSETSPAVSTFQVMQIFQKNDFRKDDAGSQQQGTMLFPLFISGESRKYGPYASIFPFYGDIYERFWRDEYHFVLFPLYGSTVKNGTTNRNYLFPIFATTEGEGESGFRVWPLYGQSAKEGVYHKRFALWPFYQQEESGLNTDNPTRKLFLFPLYAATDSPKISSRYYLWPFFGQRSEQDGGQEEIDYLWPLIRTIRGEKKTLDSFLPFYSYEESREARKRWVIWPLYCHEELDSAVFRQERDRVLYFLYTDRRESWPKDGAERRRSALWPFFVYQRDTRGNSSLTMPAPVEPILAREGIEKLWAPFWQIYHQIWNEQGDSALSILWNLYWHEVRGNDVAYELFPLISYRSVKDAVDLKLLKGLLRYRSDPGGTRFNLLWLPFGMSWQASEPASGAESGLGGGSKP